MISLVYAVSRNGVIGKDGGLPWHIPSDLKHFKAITLGKPVIMGRKTWDSLPKRPLQGRLNIVMTRDKNFRAEGAVVVAGLDQAIAAAGGASEICVIGGAQVFADFLPLAKRIYLSRVLADVEGDVKMPELTAKEWRVSSRTGEQRGEKDSAAFETVVYDRI